MLSLNTAQLWWPLGPSNRNARAKAVNDYVLNIKPEPPQIICLQEVWRRKAYEIFCILARKLNLDFHWYKSAGLMTMIPPDENNVFIDIPYERVIDYPMTHKGFTIALNCTKGLLIANTHLQAGICSCIRSVFYRNINFDEIKKQQLTQLTNHVENLFDAELEENLTLIAVCGDFNLWSDKEDEYEAVRQLMEDRLELKNAKPDPFDDEKMVDYIWLSTTVTEWHADDGMTLSDHPIIYITTK